MAQHEHKEIQGGVIVINTLVPANGSRDYPVAMADNINMCDGTDVETKIREIEEYIKDPSVNMSEIDDDIISDSTTWSSKNISKKISDLYDNVPTLDKVYLKGEVYTQAETLEAINQAITNRLESYYTKDETDGKISQAVTEVMNSTKEYVDNQTTVIRNDIAALQEKIGAGFTPIDNSYIVSLFQDS